MPPPSTRMCMVMMMGVGFYNFFFYYAWKHEEGNSDTSFDMYAMWHTQPYVIIPLPH
jgi:hypothetical protein